MPTLKEILEKTEGLTDDQKTAILKADELEYKPLTEFNTVKNALDKEKGEHKASKELLKAFGDITPTKLEEMKTKITELEDKGVDMGDMAKINKLIEKNTKPLIEQLAGLKAKEAETQAKLDIKNMEDSIRKASKGKIVDSAVTDLIYRAKEDLKKNESDGKFYASDGTAVEDYVAKIIPENPHWLPKGEGMGASGGEGAKKKTGSIEDNRARFNELMGKKNEDLKGSEKKELFELADTIKKHDKIEAEDKDDGSW